jgi:hypothetical protein
VSVSESRSRKVDAVVEIFTAKIGVTGGSQNAIVDREKGDIDDATPRS